ncbi:hypothetical protein [Kitasatospora griseola]|nr:hypothetical protein [Kitasatospora griseola]
MSLTAATFYGRPIRSTLLAGRYWQYLLAANHVKSNVRVVP